MSADLNRVTLVGRLTRDPEIRHTAGGDAIASIRLAVNSRKRGDDGEWADAPNFFDVTVFGRQAETVEKYLEKGRRIGVDGRLSWREWQAKDGTGRQAVEVVASDIFFLDSKDKASSDLPGEWGTLPSTPVPSSAGGDDIPFAPSYI